MKKEEYKKVINCYKKMNIFCSNCLFRESIPNDKFYDIKKYSGLDDFSSCIERFLSFCIYYNVPKEIAMKMIYRKDGVGYVLGCCHDSSDRNKNINIFYKKLSFCFKRENDI